MSERGFVGVRSSSDYTSFAVTTWRGGSNCLKLDCFYECSGLSLVAPACALMTADMIAAVVELSSVASGFICRTMIQKAKGRFTHPCSWRLLF